MKKLLAATVLALGGCTMAAEDPASLRATATTAEVAAPEGCTTRLTATPAHPFLAEFERKITVTCAGAGTTLELERDPGRLGRVELVRTEDGLLAITDAFQSATVRTTDPTVLDLGLHEGKRDRYTAPCTRTKVFQRARGTFLGAFDYCDHRWQFLPPT